MARCTVFLLTALQLVWIANGSNLVTQSSNLLSDKLYKELARTHPKENTVISPLSVDYILTGLSFGVNYSVRNAIGDAIGLPSNEKVIEHVYKRFITDLKNDGHVLMASKMYYDKRFKVQYDFIRKMESAFEAGVEAVDFRHHDEDATNTINKWIADNTKNRIKDFFSKGELDSRTALVDVNAVHFKSRWREVFPMYRSIKRIFYGLEGNSKIDMMQNEVSLNYVFDQSLNSHLVEVPYEGDFSMMLVVPKEKDGIVQVDQKLQSQHLLTSRLGPRMKASRIRLSLPKFNDKFEIDLTDTLKQLGMGSLFSECVLTRLSIVDKCYIYLSKVKQVAVISVNEGGTEAAAVSDAPVVTNSINRDPITNVVDADHPFVYAIRHNPTDTLLFVGRHVK